MATKQDEKHLKILRALVQQPENKRCADCLAKGPVYANTNFNTFICTTCSGIHREFGFRVKSISMASFKPEEIKNLQEGGNEVARQKWMARWSSSEHPEPDSGDLDRIRSMIRQKYVEKRWYDERGKGSSKRTDDLPRAEPLTNVLGNNIPPLKVENSQQNVRQAPPSQSQQTYQQQAPQQSRSNVVDFGAFDFQTPSPQPANVQTPFGPAQTSPIPPSQSNGMGDLIFPSSEEIQKRQQEEQQKQKALQLQQALGQMYQQSAYQNQLAMQQYYMQQQMLQMQQMQQMQMANQVGVQQNFPQGMQSPVQQTNGISPQMYVQSPVVQSNSWGVQTAPPPTQPSIPIEPEKPAKPDPFAALSPFAMGKSSPMVSTPKQQQPTTSSNIGIFGDMGVSSPPKAQTNTNSNDPFGLGEVQSQPYGISQSAHVPTPTTNNDFNPFF